MRLPPKQILFVLLLLSVLTASFLVYLLPAPESQRLILANGTIIEFLGVTTNSRHRNPSKSPVEFYLAPSMPAKILNLLPGRHPSALMVYSSNIMTNLAVAWFYLPNFTHTTEHLVLRLKNSKGQYVGGGYNLRVNTAHKTVPVPVHSDSSLDDISSIEIYQRWAPVVLGRDGVLDSAAQMKLSPGTHLGTFYRGPGGDRVAKQ